MQQVIIGPTTATNTKSSMVLNWLSPEGVLVFTIFDDVPSSSSTNDSAKITNYYIQYCIAMQKDISFSNIQLPLCCMKFCNV